MSNKYEEWKFENISLGVPITWGIKDVTRSKENLYQEFKARLIEELYVYTPELLNNPIRRQ